ncbi:MAG: hypothetical protein WC365_01540 [Candidatus Babeliales bacterium]|jgi:hypothetical protein
MVQFLIEEKFAEKLLEYLASKPYSEVVELVEGMRLLRKFEADKK